jgi:TolB-like protein
MLGRKGLAWTLSACLASALLPLEAPAAPPEEGEDPAAPEEAADDTAPAEDELVNAPAPPPATDSDATAAILPIEVDGEMSDTDRATLTTELVSGLERGAFGVVTPDQVTAQDSGAADCDKPRCYKKIAEATRATHVVKSKMLVKDRDYSIRIELVDGQNGAVLASAEDGCEICGVSDVGGLIATAAATLRTKLDALASGPATLLLSSDPNGAIVKMDGEVIGTTPIENLPVIPGKHVIRVSREGYIGIEREVTFVEGVSEKLDFSLEKLPSRLPGRGWGWGTLSVGIVGLGGGIALTFLHDKQHRANCDPNGSPVTQDGNGECKFLWNTKWAGIGTGIAGAALITLGVAILVNSSGKTKRQKGKDKDAQARRPKFELGPGSVTVRGRF